MEKGHTFRELLIVVPRRNSPGVFFSFFFPFFLSFLSFFFFGSRGTIAMGNSDASDATHHIVFWGR